MLVLLYVDCVFYFAALETCEEGFYAKEYCGDFTGYQQQEQPADQGKPPQHPIELLLFLQACFVFKTKIMHVLFLLWHFATPKLFFKILFGQIYLLV